MRSVLPPNAECSQSSECYRLESGAEAVAEEVNGLPAGLTCSTFYSGMTAHRASFGPLRSGYLQWDRYCE